MTDEEIKEYLKNKGCPEHVCRGGREGLGCDGEVRDVDERFGTMLTAPEIKHWHAERNTAYDFRNYGYPTNAAGYFLEEVKRLFLRLGNARKPLVR